MAVNFLSEMFKCFNALEYTCKELCPVFCSVSVVTEVIFGAVDRVECLAVPSIGGHHGEPERRKLNYLT